MENGLIVALVVVVVCGVVAIRNDIRRLKVQAEKEASKVAKVMNVEQKPLTVSVKHKQKKRKKRAKLKAGA